MSWWICCHGNRCPCQRARLSLAWIPFRHWFSQMLVFSSLAFLCPVFEACAGYLCAQGFYPFVTPHKTLPCKRLTLLCTNTFVILKPELARDYLSSLRALHKPRKGSACKFPCDAYRQGMSRKSCFGSSCANVVFTLVSGDLWQSFQWTVKAWKPARLDL